MAIYLLVAYQTAQSPQLLAATQELSRADPSARFVLLVPATPASDLLSKQEGDPAGIARRRAASARTWLEDIGVQMADAKVGPADPLQAISDEMEGGQSYAGIVISTLPQGVSQWLRRDLVSQARRRFPGIPVDHVISEVPAASK
jgi:hypothetical protein